MNPGDFAILGQRVEGQTTCYDVRVPLDSDYFSGHFEGRPILPAIAQLALVQRLLHEQAGSARRGIDSIAHLRFQLPLFPDDRVEVRLRAAPDGNRHSFAIQRQTKRISRGEVGLAEACAPPTVATETIEIAPATGIDPSTLLPHRPPARWIESIGERTERSIVIAGGVPPTSPFAPDGRASAFVALEFAAQGAAVLETLGRVAAGGPGAAHLGYLVGAREVQFDAPFVDAATELVAAVELEGTAGPLSIYRARIANRGRRVARATISTYITDEVAG